MLEQLTIEGFKAFGERVEIPLAPLTLIYGPNSAGKSSIIQSLLLLKQSHGIDDLPEVPVLRANGPDAQLGDLDKSFNRMAGVARMSFGIRWSAGCARFWPSFSQLKDLTRLWSADDESEGTTAEELLDQFSIGTLELCLSYIGKGQVEQHLRGTGLREHPDFERRLLTGHFGGSGWYNWVRLGPLDGLAHLAPDPRAAAWLRSADGTTDDTTDLEAWAFKWLVDGDVFCDQEMMGNTHRFLSRAGQVELAEWEAEGYLTKAQHQAIRKLLRSHPEAPYWANTIRLSFARAMFAAHRQYAWMLRRAKHLGPVREPPARLYEPVRKQPAQSDGSNSWLQTAGELQNAVSTWLSRLEIPYSVSAKKRHMGRGEIELRLRDKRRGRLTDLQDVGYGVGQLLPILFKGLTAQRGGVESLIAVEQPELHLHPRQQGGVADFLIETSQPSIDWAEVARNAEGIDGPLGLHACFPERVGVQWLVETHSEALMLRTQKRIREGQLAPDHVCVLYVEPGPRGARARRLRLDNSGQFIDEWPDGFFEERLDDLL